MCIRNKDKHVEVCRWGWREISTLTLFRLLPKRVFTESSCWCVHSTGRLIGTDDFVISVRNHTMTWRMRYIDSASPGISCSLTTFTLYWTRVQGHLTCQYNVFYDCSYNHIDSNFQKSLKTRRGSSKTLAGVTTSLCCGVNDFKYDSMTLNIHKASNSWCFIMSWIIFLDVITVFIHQIIFFMNLTQ